jgi:hypothetical protein
MDRQRRRSAMEAARLRYRGLSGSAKRKLFDELQEISGYHRKSLLRFLNRPDDQAATSLEGSPGEPEKPHHLRRYGPEVTEALVPLWEASDRLCGKRLQALLLLLVESLESHGHLRLEPGVRESLMAISSATIDRILAPIRKASRGNGWRGHHALSVLFDVVSQCEPSRDGKTTMIQAGWRSTWWRTAPGGWKDDFSGALWPRTSLPVGARVCRS